MTDLMRDDPERPEKTMAVYRPGFPLVESLKGAIGRFLPGALISFTAMLLFMQGVPGGGEFGEALLGIVAGTLGMTAGFAAGLESLRRWLYPDAKISGRKSFVAGLMAPVAIFVVGALTAAVGLPIWLAMVFLIPFALALLMFFAWLTPTPEGLRDEEYVEADELPGMLLRSWPTDGDGALPPVTAGETATARTQRGTG